MTAIINSDFAFSVIRRIKSARHIEKKIWELPIPEFEEENDNHSELSVIGRKCAVESKAVLDEEIKKLSNIHSLQTGTVGTLRKKIKNYLEADMSRINSLAATLVQNTE